MRIAIVGCGPKGTFALERLLAYAWRGTTGPIEIDLFDPHPSPGAGPVYGPGQPSYLIMNFSSDKVDMWWRGDGPVTPGSRPTFQEWRGSAADDYAPRAEVGRYLIDGLGRLISSAPPQVRITSRRHRIDSIRRLAGAWDVEADREILGTYSHVLLTTGHEPLGSGGVRADTEIPARGTIAVRGFALTFIDAALDLTEGRGGTFTAGDWGGLVYRGDRSLRIVPFSRSGRPMLAKPARGSADLDLEAAAGMGIAALDVPLRDVAADLPSVLAGLLPLPLREPAKAWLGAACAGELPEGGTEPALGSALGRAWRAAYPALVDRLGADGIADGEWPAFRRLAGELERVAFGPPPINIAKLRALADAGVLDLSRAPLGPPDDADAIIDAVMPAPGVPGDGLLRRLVDDGHARTAPNRRGLEVSDSCACIGGDGEPTPGLAAYGRPTEDWIIGNDTLSRTLHPQIDRWAERAIATAPHLQSA